MCSACTHSDCSWGIRPDGTRRGRKHSDGSEFAPEVGAQEIALTIDEPETTPDEVTELLPEQASVVAGQDDEAEVESGSEEVVGSEQEFEEYENSYEY